MRWTVKETLSYYSKLDPEALEYEVRNIRFRGYDANGIPEFESDDGPATLDFLESLGETTYTKNPRDDYRYKDGATARFIQYRRCFDIKDQKKVIGRVYLLKA